MLENGPQAFFYRPMSFQGKIGIWAHSFHLLKIFFLIGEELPPAV
jgi:hypothetical protein